MKDFLKENGELLNEIEAQAREALGLSPKATVDAAEVVDEAKDED